MQQWTKWFYIAYTVRLVQCRPSHICRSHQTLSCFDDKLAPFVNIEFLAEKVHQAYIEVRTRSLYLKEKQLVSFHF